MAHAQDLSMLSLAQHTLLSLAGGSGKGLAVFSGRVWITEEGDLEDKVLVAGESIVLRRPGLVLVEAIEPAQVMLFEGTSLASPVATVAPVAPVASRVEPARVALPSREQIERLARELRRQAIRDMLDGLAEHIARLGAALRAGWRGTPSAARRQQVHCN